MDPEEHKWDMFEDIESQEGKFNLIASIALMIIGGVVGSAMTALLFWIF